MPDHISTCNEVLFPTGFRSARPKLMERMPKPNPKEIKAFQKLYFKQYGEKLSDADAEDAAIRFLQMFVMTSPKLYDLYNGSPEDAPPEEPINPPKPKPTKKVPPIKPKPDKSVEPKPPKRSVDGLKRRVVGPSS